MIAQSINAGETLTVSFMSCKVQPLRLSFIRGDQMYIDGKVTVSQRSYMNPVGICQGFPSDFS